MGVKEIEKAITQLPTDELAKLSVWFTDYQAEIWDNQIKQDLKNGKMDKLLKEVDTEFEAGKAKPL